MYYCNCSYYCNIVILYTMCQSYHLSTLYHPLLYNYILVWLKKWPPGAAPAFNSNQLNKPSILGQEFLLLSVLCYCDNWPLTVFPQTVAAATILFRIHRVRKVFKFLFPLCNENLNSFLTRWGNYSRRGNYSREETIWGNTVYLFLSAVWTHCA